MEESINKQVKFELLWQGSRDGFTAAKFHANCNNKGPTVTVIKSNYDQIFGGFTSESWGFAGSTAKQGVNKKDPTAFIYSLSKEVKCAEQLNDNSIQDYPGCGPIFGFNGFCDIGIDNNCDKRNNGCWANKTYKLPAGADDSYLAGSQWFSVKEIEVYAVKTI